MSTGRPPPRQSPDHAAGGSAPSNLSSDTLQRLVVLGYITAVAMPPIGLILGLLLAGRLNKPNSKQGIWIIVVSVIATGVWVLALAVGLLDPNSDTSTT